MVNVKDVEAQLKLLGLVVEAEWQEELDESHDRNLRFVVALRHPEVQHFAEVRFVDTNDVLDILLEVILGEGRNAVDDCALNLVLLCLSVEIGKSLHDGTVLRFRGRLLEVGQFFVVMGRWHHNLGLLVLVFLLNSLLYWS